MRTRTEHPVGSLHLITIDSAALAGNLLGDPLRRQVHVYTPPGLDDGGGAPLLVDLVGFTGSGFSHTAWKNFGENVPERVDRLIAEGMPPVCVAFPDCFTRLGGNQYVNSVVMGRWEDFLIDEMLPAIEARFRCGGPGRRGVFGKSSGGFGAIYHAMKHADTWSAAACHSGDMGFELVYEYDFPNVLRALAKAGGIEPFVREFEATDKHDDAAVHALMGLAMAATYDPDPQAFLGIHLPVDLETCERDDERWARWLAFDPVRIAADHADALRSLRGLFIDCGDVDQYNLVYGARRLHRILEGLDVRHTYEEFADNHSSIDRRMDVSLPLLARALTS
ncbi:MAG TPA: alpha/beta hydrolase-fold protein [Kofleriaceae bacterium]|nr:alpha/beta hydrolase-fold protein [Kofleriaceae bacterium]